MTDYRNLDVLRQRLQSFQRGDLRNGGMTIK
jgi:hypothetical protein